MRLTGRMDMGSPPVGPRVLIWERRAESQTSDDARDQPRRVAQRGNHDISATHQLSECKTALIVWQMRKVSRDRDRRQWRHRVGWIVLGVPGDVPAAARYIVVALLRT